MYEDAAMVLPRSGQPAWIAPPKFLSGNSLVEYRNAFRRHQGRINRKAEMTSTAALDSELYYRIRDDLWSNHPAARAAITEAAANLPDLPVSTAMLHAHKGLFVEKPLYSNMRASKGGLGDRYSFMWRDAAGGWFPSPEALAGPEWEIEQTGNREYAARGAAVIAFRNAPRRLLGPAFPGKTHPQVSLERLFRMRKIASRFDTALPALQEAQSGFSRAQTADDFLTHVTPVLEAFDTGALTTMLHAMTDLGFQCIKPDLHAARTLAWFNQLEVRRPQAGTNVNAQAFQNPLGYLQNNWNKCHVVSRGVALARTLAPSRTLPLFRGNTCREADIVLMQASLHNVILKHK